MPSAYIAKISGTAGSYQVSTVRQMALSDIPPDQSANWRDMEVRYPNFDNATQVLTGPIFSVNADGSVVTMTFGVDDFAPPWAAMNLANLANQRSEAKAAGGLTLPNGVALSTDSAKSGEIVDAIETIERGLASEPFTIQTATGQWVALSKADLLAAWQAIAKFRLDNLAARKACLDAIDAGSITTSAQVLAAI